jgi:hypothetical protein
MPTVVYRPKNRSAKNQHNNNYNNNNLNKRIDMLIGRIDALLRRL